MLPESMLERWAQAPGFPDYEVSTLGKVRRATLGMGTRGAFVLSAAAVGSKGGLVVGLQRKGKSYHKLVRVLVAEAFMGPSPEGMRVVHRDGNRADCRLSNLQRMSNSEVRKRNARRKATK